MLQASEVLPKGPVDLASCTPGCSLMVGNTERSSTFRVLAAETIRHSAARMSGRRRRRSPGKVAGSGGGEPTVGEAGRVSTLSKPWPIRTSSERCAAKSWAR